MFGREMLYFFDMNKKKHLTYFYFFKPVKNSKDNKVN